MVGGLNGCKEKCVVYGRIHNVGFSYEQKTLEKNISHASHVISFN